MKWFSDPIYALMRLINKPVDMLMMKLVNKPAVEALEMAVEWLKKKEVTEKVPGPVLVVMSWFRKRVEENPWLEKVGSVALAYLAVWSTLWLLGADLNVFNHLPQY
jgi:methionine synthase II (cobalamin-independent)